MKEDFARACIVVNWCVVCPLGGALRVGLECEFSFYEDISPRRSLGSIHKSLLFLLASGVVCCHSWIPISAIVDLLPIGRYVGAYRRLAVHVLYLVLDMKEKIIWSKACDRLAPI